MSTPENPFASPPEIDDDAVVGEVGEEEQIRRKYLGHETAVQAMGGLYYLGAVVLGLVGLSTISTAVIGGGVVSERIVLGCTAVLWFFLAMVIIVLGRGLRKLARWVNIPVGILSVLGLCWFPFGTLINGYFLYVVFCRGGRMVFSPEYHDVIDRTPHIKRKTATYVIILVVVLMIILVGSIQYNPEP